MSGITSYGYDYWHELAMKERRVRRRVHARNKELTQQLAVAQRKLELAEAQVDMMVTETKSLRDRVTSLEQFSRRAWKAVGGR